MRLVYWFTGLVIVVAVAAGGYLITQRDDTGTLQTSEIKTGEQGEAGATMTACDIFTDTVAKDILGASFAKGDESASPQASTDDVSVTVCTYDNGAANISELQAASVLVRGAKTSQGKESNKFGFSNNKKLDKAGGQTGTFEPITGLGDEAYWSADLGQANVLVDDGTYWLIVGVGANATGTGDKIRSEQLARAVVAKL